MRVKFFEEKRLQMIEAVSRRRKQIIGDMEGDSDSETNNQEEAPPPEEADPSRQQTRQGFITEVKPDSKLTSELVSQHDTPKRKRKRTMSQHQMELRST